MSRRLIVNADGFGMTRGVNRAIVEVCQAGFVRSVSVNTTFPAFDEVPDLVDALPHIGLGIHFNATVGRPILAPSLVPSLVNGDGLFLGRGFVQRAARGQIVEAELERELDAQLARLSDIGVPLDHWDSHQGMHVYEPFLTAASRCASRANIPCARSHHYHLLARSDRAESRDKIGFFARRPGRLATFAARRMITRSIARRGFHVADRAVLLGALPETAPHSPATWRRLLEALPEGTSEVWCHPGYPDDELRAHATLVDTRFGELRALTDSTLNDAATARGIHLCRFSDDHRARISADSRTSERS